MTSSTVQTRMFILDKTSVENCCREKFVTLDAKIVTAPTVYRSSVNLISPFFVLGERGRFVLSFETIHT